MAVQIKKCLEDHTYTLENTCPKCQQKVFPPRPPKFSLSDKYARYRRVIKKKELKEKGLY